MIILGNADHESSGNKCTLHFFADDTEVATVHNDVVQKFNVTRSVTGVALIELHLAGPKGVGLAQLSENWDVEIHVKTRQFPVTHRLARAKVDLWELDYDESQCRLHIQGRSSCAILIDEACRLTFDGELVDFLATVGNLHQVPIATSQLGSRPIELSADCASAYGVLRLLGLSLDMVVSCTDDTTVNVMTLSGANDALQARPVLKLTDKEIQSATLKKGSPVRKRQ